MYVHDDGAEFRAYDSPGFGVWYPSPEVSGHLYYLIVDVLKRLPVVRVSSLISHASHFPSTLP